MKHPRKLVTASAVLALGALAVAAARPFAQQGEEMEEMAMPTPTAEHQQLQKSVGEWEGTVTMMMPGMPADPSPARETVRSIGGFWTSSDFTSEFMGMPYEGHGCHGFDPESKQYVSTWIDNYSSFLNIMKGEMNADGTMVMNWTAPNMMGEMAPHRSVTKFTEDSYTMEFFTDGQPTMVIKMKRMSGKAREAGAPK